MQTILAIAAGGALGAVMRHILNNTVTNMLGTGFPWGIFTANILGSFIMGCLVSFFALSYDPPQAVKAFLAVGMLGAFTTFSTFSLDTVLLLEKGAYVNAGLYVIGSVILAVGGLFAGMALVRAIIA